MMIRLLSLGFILVWGWLLPACKSKRADLYDSTPLERTQQGSLALTNTESQNLSPLFTATLSKSQKDEPASSRRLLTCPQLKSKETSCELSNPLAGSMLGVALSAETSQRLRAFIKTARPDLVQEEVVLAWLSCEGEEKIKSFQTNTNFDCMVSYPHRENEFVLGGEIGLEIADKLQGNKPYLSEGGAERTVKVQGALLCYQLAQSKEHDCVLRAMEAGSLSSDFIPLSRSALQGINEELSLLSARVLAKNGEPSAQNGKKSSGEEFMKALTCQVDLSDMRNSGRYSAFCQANDP